VDDQLNNRQKEILQRLLADPTDIGSVYLSNLQDLVKTYPQSGLFRALYGRAVNESSPSIAGAYFDSRALHKLLFHPDNISTIAKERVIFQNGFHSLSTPVAEKIAPVVEVKPTPVEPESVKSAVPAEPPAGIPEVLSVPPTIEPIVETKPAEPIKQPEVIAPPVVVPIVEPAPVVEIPTANRDDEPLGRAPWELDDDYEQEAPQPVAEEPAPAPVEFVAEEQYEEQVADEPIITAPWEAAPATAPVEEEPLVAASWELPQVEAAAAWESDEDIIAGEDINDRLAYWNTIEDEYDAPAVPRQAIEVPFYTNEEGDINDDVYDEVNSVDDIIFEPNTTGYYEAPAETEAAEPNEADRLIMGNIAATDYFSFDRAFGDRSPVEDVPRAPEPAPQPVAKSAPRSKPRFTLAEENTTHHDVSKYHDEKMPYSFMWWLDKTRKEHGSLYQPYVQPQTGAGTTQNPARKPTSDELQQQYYENIFHFSSVEEFGVETPPTIEFDMQSKEDRIIQRFITEDPHIHPPVGEKLDTENKAKKSSEDSDIMVTETLARIYADQMLFPKAIATYKKLMLKFPEKSRYFASRIENLEKKNN